MPEDDSPTPGLPNGSATNAVEVMLAGFVGGILAVLMRHIREFFTSGVVSSRFDTQVWIFVIGFGVLGAVLVRIFREPNAGKAFIFGIALPSFLINLGAGVSNDPARAAERATQPQPATVEDRLGVAGRIDLNTACARLLGLNPPFLVPCVWSWA